MEQGWSVVIGMSIAYIASFAGMLFAYLSYRRRKKRSGGRRTMPEYSFFWGIFVPGLILSISTGVTFWLYRHFSTRDDGVSADKRNRIQRDRELKIAGEAGPGAGQEGITKGEP